MHHRWLFLARMGQVCKLGSTTVQILIILYFFFTVDAANSLKPNPLPTHKFQKGLPELLQNGKEKVIHITFDKSKEERILGIKFKTLLETTRDTMENFASRGW